MRLRISGNYVAFVKKHPMGIAPSTPAQLSSNSNIGKVGTAKYVCRYLPGTCSLVS